MNLAKKMTLPGEIAGNPKKGEKIAIFCNLGQNQVPHFSVMLLFLQLIIEIL